MTRGYVALIAAIVSLTGAPTIVHGQSPADIHLGFTPLTLVAEGSRTDQLGGEALYTVAVYAEARPLDLARLAKADTAKALRIEVVSDDDPFAPLTRPWRRELVPRLDPVATTHLLAILGIDQEGRRPAGRICTREGHHHPGKHADGRVARSARPDGRVPGSVARPAAGVGGLEAHPPRMVVTARLRPDDVSTKTTGPRSKAPGGTCRRSRSDTSAKSTAMKNRRWMALPSVRRSPANNPTTAASNRRPQRPRWLDGDAPRDERQEQDHASPNRGHDVRTAPRRDVHEGLSGANRPAYLVEGPSDFVEGHVPGHPEAGPARSAGQPPAAPCLELENRGVLQGVIAPRGHVQPERPERREHERQGQEREHRQQPGHEEEVAGRDAARLGRQDQGREHRELDEEGQQRPAEEAAGCPHGPGPDASMHGLAV